MIRLARLVRILRGGSHEPGSGRLEALQRSATLLQRDVRAIRDGLTELTERLDAIQLQTQRLSFVHEAERDADVRMEQLERVLDSVQVARHVREAVRRAEFLEAPVPHGIVAAVLPSDVYASAADAIPPRLLFDSRRGRTELALPPALAPTYMVATWAFLTDIAKEVLIPALLERFEGPLRRHARLDAGSQSMDDARGRLTMSRNRLTIGDRAETPRPDSDSADGPITVSLCVAPRAHPAANSAVVALGPPLHFTPFPVVAAPAEPWCAWQFRIGPT